MKHEESKIQQRCVEWFRYSFPRTLIASFPNGVFIGGTPVQRAKRWNILKAEGAMPGMPDLMICMSWSIPRPVHRDENRKRQTIRHTKNRSRTAYQCRLCVKVCRSFEEFTITIKTYLEQ